jgi:hypothetical protein
VFFERLWPTVMVDGFKANSHVILSPSTLTPPLSCLFQLVSWLSLYSLQFTELSSSNAFAGHHPTHRLEKMVKLLLLLCGAILGLSAAQDSACLNPPLENDMCGFYPNCLETWKPCGAHGYALGYGLKYCDAFTSNTSLSCMDDGGKVWINSTLECLQEALVPLIEGNPDNITCPAIKSFAFNSHPTCYTGGGGAVPIAPSICFMPQDWKCLFETIDLKDLLSPRGIKQEIDTGIICLKQLGCDKAGQDDPRCDAWKDIISSNSRKIHS